MFGLDFIRKLRPCSWRYDKPLDDGKHHLGFIAQDVDEIASHEQFGFVTCGKDGILRLNMAEFVGPIVQAIKELDEKIKRIEERIEKRNG